MPRLGKEQPRIAYSYRCSKHLQKSSPRSDPPALHSLTPSLGKERTSRIDMLEIRLLVLLMPLGQTTHPQYYVRSRDMESSGVASCDAIKL